METRRDAACGPRCEQRAASVRSEERSMDPALSNVGLAQRQQPGSVRFQPKEPAAFNPLLRLVWVGVKLSEAAGKVPESLFWETEQTWRV